MRSQGGVGASRPAALVCAVLFLPLVAGGCALGGTTKVAPKLYDFGVAEGSSAPVPPVALGAVTQAPSLGGTEIRYRWASDPYQARAYSESRWLAPPSDLLGSRLAAALSSSRAAGRGGLAALGGAQPTAPLRLNVELATFEQVFDAPDRARAVLRLVAEVQDSRTRSTVARRVIAEERPTPTPDAAGAVTALVELADGAVGDLLRWLAEEIEVPAEPVVEPAEPGENGSPAGG